MFIFWINPCILCIFGLGFYVCSIYVWMFELRLAFRFSCISGFPLLRQTYASFEIGLILLRKIPCVRTYLQSRRCQPQLWWFSWVPVIPTSFAFLTCDHFPLPNFNAIRPPLERQFIPPGSGKILNSPNLGLGIDIRGHQGDSWQLSRLKLAP